MVVHITADGATDGERLQSLLSDPIKDAGLPLGGDGVSVSRVSIKDFDECSSPEHNDCADHAACNNVEGSYECQCKTGYHDLSGNDSPPGRVCSGKCHHDCWFCINDWKQIWIHSYVRTSIRIHHLCVMRIASERHFD